MEKSFDELLSEAKAQVSGITPQKANELKNADPNVVFIDPRNAADIASSTGIIPGSLNIPLNELNETNDHDLPVALTSRNCAIITACQAGPMGALAAHALKKRGYSNVAFMLGGTQGWLDAGYPTLR